MGEWKPVSFAPRDRLILLAHVKYPSITLAGWSDYYQKWSVPSDSESGDMYPEEYFTHYMELPAPPEQENGK